ncbi:hypothetical protein LLG46_13410 [bacterium]|nr:hypothetical protein [bacterium]
MKKQTTIILVLIAAAIIVYGAVTLLSPKPQYVFVPTDRGPGQGGQFGPPGNGEPPAHMAPPGTQPGNMPNTEKPNSTETAQKPSAAVSVEEDTQKGTAKQTAGVTTAKKPPTSIQPKQAGTPPMVPGQKDGRTMRPSFELVRVVMDIGRLEESKKDSITASQAKAILAVINPLRSKKTLDAAQAKTAASKLNSILTSAQKKTISELPRKEMKRPEGQKGEQPPPGGAPPSDGSQPAGPPPNMGARPDMDTNPLGSNSPMAKMIEKTIKSLEAKAK